MIQKMIKEVEESKVLDENEYFDIANRTLG